MNNFIFIVPKEDIGIRIDIWISKNTKDFSRSQIQKLIENGDVRVNGKSVVKKYKLCENDNIVLNTDILAAPEIKAEEIELNIVFEDEYLAVVNKPKGMVVHPAVGNYSGTLVNALLWKYGKDGLSGINGELRPGIVHRIDKNTSGLLIIAKTDIAHVGLAEQIKNHSFLRKYEAIICGHLKKNEGSMDYPIGRSPKDRKKMAVVYENCKPAKTKYKVLREYLGYSQLELELFTGRTHQIRVHMAHIGHPVAGDEVYGQKKKDTELKGQCLHARTIGFIHPITGENLFFTSDLPEYFKKFINKIS